MNKYEKKNLLKYYILHPLIRALNYDNLKKQIFLNIKNIILTK